MVQWTENEICVEGATERAFTVDRAGDAIPGVFWRPETVRNSTPLVLLGHGGSGHKRNGPAHGDRGPVTNSNDPAYRELWQRENPVQAMVDDWKAILDVLTALDHVDPERVGYWGVSMGTMFGLPFVASEQRIQVAVLGKAGMTGSSPTRSGIAPHFERFAPLLTQPVLFSIQWDDERFDRDGQLDLFDRLGSTDKRLHAYPGEHSDNGPEAFETQAAFLKRYL
jgi:dienelactone hydrolase